MKEKPFIHLFKTSIGNYLYDVNTNKIISISQELFLFLTGENVELSENIEKEKTVLKNAGYLKAKHVLKSEHRETDMLQFYYKNKVNYLILQVTQNCNMRCQYCIYSGNYKTRSHSNKIMTWDTAQKGLDFLLRNSRNEYELMVGFYGGEPLLNFSLIKKCVEYMERHSAGKKCKYVMTTNLTLLNDEIADYLIEKQFVLTVSIDGPEEIHDRNRRFAATNFGSFQKVLQNLQLLYNKDRVYYKKNVQFSTVMTSNDGFKKINDFFINYFLFEDADFNAVVVSNIYSKEQKRVSEKFIVEKRYVMMKIFLSKMGFLSEDSSKSISDDEINEMINTYIQLHKRSYQELPDRWHHGGPCIPGIKRLFLNADGNFYPCEKVCENDKNAVLGNVEEGIYLEKAKEMINIEQLMSQKCQHCWAYSYCKICVMQILDAKLSDLDFAQAMDIKCNSIKQAVENAMKDYTIIARKGLEVL